MFKLLSLLSFTLPLFPEQASSFSGEVDALFLFLLLLTLFFSLLIAGLIIVFALRFRRRSELELPQPITGSTKLETVWSVIPFILVMIIFGWGAKVFFTLSRPPSDAMRIDVVGKQWMWKLQHRTGQREINELHVPVNRSVQLTLATEDVIHSFYIPAFRIKMDVVPGRYTTAWFKATKPGTYHLFCAEYCGTKHSGMIGQVVVMEPAEFEDWLSGGASGASLVSQGQKLFQSHACHTCHRPDGNGRGPVLEGIYGKPVTLQTGEVVIADDNYLRESILTPRNKVVAGYQPVMPTFQGLISEEGILQILAYLRSLTPQSEQGGPATPTAIPSATIGGRQ
ncbi:MAG: cytochrome c oxidase subunit II [Acidobacteriota bacterium]